MKKSILRQYAKLIVRCGVNVQKGQEVIIHADLDQPEFVQMVVEEAYSLLPAATRSSLPSEGLSLSCSLAPA